MNGCGQVRQGKAGWRNCNLRTHVREDRQTGWPDAVAPAVPQPAEFTANGTGRDDSRRTLFATGWATAKTLPASTTSKRPMITSPAPQMTKPRRSRIRSSRQPFRLAGTRGRQRANPDKCRAKATPRDTVRNVKRMGRDSNPRWTFAHAGFQDRCLKPLGHPSKLRRYCSEVMQAATLFRFRSGSPRVDAFRHSHYDEPLLSDELGERKFADSRAKRRFGDVNRGWNQRPQARD